MTLTCMIVTKHRKMVLTNVRNTIHADSLAFFALNIDILRTDVTKSEKSNIPTLTWPVTSSMSSRSNFTQCLESLRTGLSSGVSILEIGPVIWEITGGGGVTPPPPPPKSMCDSPDPNGVRVN